ncbi:TetR family transcriptional regulator [Phytohabitans suffuscus]|uniref:TetR family transcriptional regulator n=2 Tax=Phytohabitans suffuscus TaxID=624315 RepID=A0A6F8YRP5_9ACTN|nr:TetR family transcriptional regulator [Phytohabitans suffuscus]
MSDAPAAPFHVGLTPGRIVDIALDLTRQSHLAGWSIRDLARRLDVAPSVIYHHVGGKDLLARYVVERVLDGLAPPPADLDWQDWFGALLDACYPPVVAHPGVAKWVLMHGPMFPSVLPVMEAGMRVLRRAGFGDRVGFAFAVLLNNAMLTVSMGDDRLLHEDDGPRDHATMMEDFRRAATTAGPGVTALADTFITPFAQGGRAAARQREAYYTFVVRTTIAGLATLLPES